MSLFKNVRSTLENLSTNELTDEIKAPKKLLLKYETYRGKFVEVAYAPFDHVNTEAKIVIVGITPGRQQMENALRKAHSLIRAGRSDEDVMRDAKVFASFSGAMRSNLVAMLDSVGVNNLLGIKSTASLWNEDSRLVHFTSALRYPVFVDGKDYNCNPSIEKVSLLQNELETWFGSEMETLKNAIFVPLGPKITEAVEKLAAKVGISNDQVISGMPHPSGANAERIAYFLKNKKREDLSIKVNPDLIERNCQNIIDKVAGLVSQQDANAAVAFS